MKKLGGLFLVFLALSAATDNIIKEVRSAISKDDFAAAEKILRDYQSENGVTPEMLEALSWLGRGSLSTGDHTKAEAFAIETHQLALEHLKTRELDDERRLPIALGAAIEVQAQVLAARNERSAAVSFLSRELETYKHTSIRTRIQKNIHLLSLEGEVAPEIETGEWVGPKPQTLAELRGRPVLLFFWAHWCPDCKWEAPVLARLQSEFSQEGLAIVGPTQRYGYTARGQDATPDEEIAYIDKIRQEHYAEVPGMPVPVSEETFRGYGSSTTPTLVLVDRAGIVRMYHPGEMSYEELAPRVQAVLAQPTGSEIGTTAVTP